MEPADNFLILFADLVGSTEVAVEATPESFSRLYVASYHWAARRAFSYISEGAPFPACNFTRKIEKPRVAGDEVLSFTPMPRDEIEAQDLVASAITFAYITKLFWLASPYNLTRILGKQFPRGFAVGIHIGPAVYVPTDEDERQIASLHINVAKRIEGIAREGKQSRIFASYEVKKYYHKWIDRYKFLDKTEKPLLWFTGFTERDNPELLKGIPKPLQLFELEWASQGTSNFDFILSQLQMSPDHDDIDNEKAARDLINAFFPDGNKPFFHKKMLQVEYPFAANISTYIDNWFKGIDTINALFFDEYWLVISSYLVSCSMLKHKLINTATEQFRQYKNITNRVHDRLSELPNAAK